MINNDETTTYAKQEPQDMPRPGEMITVKLVCSEQNSVGAESSEDEVLSHVGQGVIEISVN